MTVNEFIHFLIPILGVVFLIVLIILGIQAVSILIRIKRMVERAETISDISGWAGIIRKFLKKKNPKV